MDGLSQIKKYINRIVPIEGDPVQTIVNGIFKKNFNTDLWKVLQANYVHIFIINLQRYQKKLHVDYKVSIVTFPPIFRFFFINVFLLLMKYVPSATELPHLLSLHLDHHLLLHLLLHVLALLMLMGCVPLCVDSIPSFIAI